MTGRRLVEHLLRPEGLPAAYQPARVEIEDPNGEPERMMRRGEPGQLHEPADERLRVAHADAHVDPPEQSIAGKSRPGLRQARDARRRPSRPGWGRGRVEAKLADLGPGLVHVRLELPSGAQRIDHERPAAREHELAQVHVPVALARPADVLSRCDDLAGLHDRVDVPVSEVPDSREATRATRGREEHGPAFDREDPMGAADRRSSFGPIVAHRDVDPVVVDRAEVGVGPRIQERAANRMLSVERLDRPASPGVVVDLRDIQLPGDPLRHQDTIVTAFLRTGGRVGSRERAHATGS